MRNCWKEKTENLIQGLERKDALTTSLEAEKPPVVVETALQKGSVETGMLPRSVAFELQLNSVEDERSWLHYC